MKTEIEKLEQWLVDERANYEKNKHKFSDEKALEEVQRQLVLQEVHIQLLRFQTKCTEEFLNTNFPIKTN